MVGDPVLLVNLQESSGSLAQKYLRPLKQTEAHAPALWVARTGLVREALTALWSDLQSGAVRSAALLPEQPSRDSLWLALEWWGKLVVDRRLINQIPNRELWDLVEGGGDRFEVQILLPRRQSKRELSFRIRRVESSDEYRASLLSGEPVAVSVRPLEIANSENALREWFGNLGDPTVGGAIALLTLSGARLDNSEIFLRSPAALGLEMSLTDSTALASYSRRGKVRVAAAGGTVQQGSVRLPIKGQERKGENRSNHRPLDAESISHALERFLGEPQISSYYVLLGVEAVVDPEVVLPKGAIFEQTSVNGVQTLAAAMAKSFHLDVGQFLPVTMPVWCLNPGLHSPSGEEVRPTPLSYSHGENQQVVWEGLRQHLEDINL